MRTKICSSILGRFWRIRPSANFDKRLPERPFVRADEPPCSLAVWACVAPPSAKPHAVLLNRDSWMCFDKRSYSSLPLRPSGHRIFGELELSRHAPAAGVHDYSIDPVASCGGFYFRYDSAVGVTLSDVPQVRAVHLVHNNGSQALTGHYLIKCSPSLTCPRWRNTLSPLGDRSFPSLGWRISSLETSSESATPHSCAFRWTPCSTTGHLPAFPLAYLR